MKIRWFGQSAFLLTSEDGTAKVAIDPFGEVTFGGDVRFYRPVPELDADLLLITHEHRDHNGAERVSAGQTIRSTAGRFETPLGEVLGIASEHDEVAGTARGANVIYRFELDGLACAHFGDFGQSALRPEQREALGTIDVLFLPAGGSPTVSAAVAATIVEELAPRVVVPMHFRTDAIDFLDPPDALLDALAGWDIERVATNEASLTAAHNRHVLVLAP